MEGLLVEPKNIDQKEALEAFLRAFDIPFKGEFELYRNFKEQILFGCHLDGDQEKLRTIAGYIEHIEWFNQSECYRALQSTKVDEASDIELNQAVSEAMAKALKDFDNKNDLRYRVYTGEEFDYLVDTIVEEVRMLFPKLTLDEIKLACRYGSFGLYGDTTHVCVSFVLRWLRAFVNDSRRQQAIKNFVEIF